LLSVACCLVRAALWMIGEYAEKRGELLV
jgi:hypothetical protein